MLHLNVEGMSCGGCARSVTNAIKAVDPQAEVRVDLARKTVEADTSADPGAVSRAITDAGYTVSSAQ
jgi:copper chaperone